MNEVYLSVIIPCFDEMVNLRKGVLDRIEHFLKKKEFNFEVIIVDDGSTDGSVDFIDKFIKDANHFFLIKNPHFGKAGAITTGMLSAKGQYRLFTDMDQATPIEELDKLLAYAEQGYDIAIGSRSNRRKGAPWTRKFISRANIILRKLLVGLPDISDTQCGFKLFKADSAEKLFSKIKAIHHGFRKVDGSAVTAGFDVELLYLATKRGYRIKEVTVDWLHVESRRINVVKDSITGLLDLIKIRFNQIKGLYNV